MTVTRWLIVTAEYPPHPGGVADYTRLLAHSLAASGDTVELLAPDLMPGYTDPPVSLVPLPDRFGTAARQVIRGRVRAAGRHAIILLQWVPQAFGWRGLNLPFAVGFAGLPARRWVMFHEVAMGFDRGRPMWWHAMAAVQHLMAGILGQTAERRFVSTPGWRRMLRTAGVRRPAVWVPIPSTLPAGVPPAPPPPWPGPTLVYFGTYGPDFAAALSAVLRPVLRNHPSAGVVLLGRGSDRFAAGLLTADSGLAGRVCGRGELPTAEAAAQLAAADLAVYPYPDGVTARRTSVMAALALGLPVVTTRGPWTEPEWSIAGLYPVPAGHSAGFAAAVGRLLADPAARAELGRRGQQLYSDRFDIRHTVAALRAAAGTRGSVCCDA